MSGCQMTVTDDHIVTAKEYRYCFECNWDIAANRGYFPRMSAMSDRRGLDFDPVSPLLGNAKVERFGVELAISIH